MHGLSLALQFALSCVLVAVCTLSVQLAVLAWVRVFRKSPKLLAAPLRDDQLPHVLVQLPVCNEGLLAVRVAEAAAAMDYPRDRLTIQLLDDGDGDGHAALARDAMAVTPEGVKLDILRRGNRTGFKAGNLAFGLKHCDAPYVAIFDADFVPPPDFLRRTVPVLVADQGLAFVQARWSHANRNANWLTRVQGLLAGFPFRGGTGSALPRRSADFLQRHRRRLVARRDRRRRRLDRRHPDRRSRSFHALHDAGLARRDDAGPDGAGRTAADRRRLARTAGALDQGPCAMRPQASAAGLGQRNAALEKGGDDPADVPVRFLHAGFLQRRDLADPDVYGRGAIIPAWRCWA